MAVTIVIFAVAQILMATQIRPNLIPPVQVTAPFNANTASEIMLAGDNKMTVQGNFSPVGAWVLSNKTVSPSGHVFTGPATGACTGTSSPQHCNSYLNSLHLRQLVSYQPASRFWPLQWLETAVYLVLAAGLAVLCTLQIRRRQS
jgi:hypothetical protein